MRNSCGRKEEREGDGRQQGRKEGRQEGRQWKVLKVGRGYGEKGSGINRELPIYPTSFFH